MQLKLTICRADEVVNLIRTAEREGKQYHAVISLEHPCDASTSVEQGRAPRLADELGSSWQDRQLILTCWDIERPVVHIPAPSADMVEAALGFAQSKCPDYGDMRVLIHCRSGKARSPALALVLCRAYAPSLTEEACLQQILALRPTAAPNMAIIEHGDRILGCDGRLIAAVTADADVTMRRAAADRARMHQIESLGL